MESTEFLLIFIVAIQAHSVTGGLIPVNGTDSPSDTAYLQADKFLTSYGYYPSSGRRGGHMRNSNLRKHSDTERAKALKLFQKFYNLPQSGKLDKETTQLMKSPRCGIPDIVSNLNTKRTAAGLEKEEEKDVTRTRKDNGNQEREKSRVNVDGGRRSLDMSRKTRVKRYSFVQGPGVRQWRKERMKWVFEHNYRFSPRIPKYMVDRSRVLRKALLLWERFSPFYFEEETNLPVADINIRFHSFADTRPEEHVEYFFLDMPGDRENATMADVPGGEQQTQSTRREGLRHAHAMPPTYNAYGETGQIHFDEDYNWSDEELFSVTLHQIGHVLGLGHSHDNTSVMYPYDVSEPRLSLDDIHGIIVRYGNIFTEAPRRPAACNEKLRNVDYIFPAPFLGPSTQYFVITGNKLQLLSETESPFNQSLVHLVTEVFPGAPSQFDVVFAERTHKSVFFIAGNKLYQFKGPLLYNKIDHTIPRQFLPEKPLFAVTVKNDSLEITVLFGKNHHWIFEFDGENVVYDGNLTYSNYDAFNELVSDGKFLVQRWTDGLLYIVKQNGSFSTLDFDGEFPTNGLSNEKYGEPIWMENLLCPRFAACIREPSIRPHLCFTNGGQSSTRWGTSRSSMILFFIIGLIKL